MSKLFYGLAILFGLMGPALAGAVPLYQDVKCETPTDIYSQLVGLAEIEKINLTLSSEEDIKIFEEWIRQHYGNEVGEYDVTNVVIWDVDENLTGGFPYFIVVFESGCYATSGFLTEADLHSLTEMFTTE